MIFGCWCLNKGNSCDSVCFERIPFLNKEIDTFYLIIFSIPLIRFTPNGVGLFYFIDRKRFKYYPALENRQFSEVSQDDSNNALRLYSIWAWGCCLSDSRVFGDTSKADKFNSSHAFFIV